MNEQYYKKNNLINLPKSDIHSHAGRSGNIEFLEMKKGCKIERPPHRFESLDDMQKWFEKNIKSICTGKEGMYLRWEAGFYEARRNNIQKLCLSFSTSEITMCGGMDTFIELINSLYIKYIPNAIFIPELTFDSQCDIEYECNKMDEILPYGFFKSIDVCGRENVRDIHDYLPLYQKAEKYQLIKRMHVGEFGTADDVRKAVITLNLDEINHGIAAASDPNVMKLLRERRIKLNICPSSNIMLGIVKDYQSHPIKILYDNKVIVTINTDDLLIFNQSIDQEYLNLYNAKTLNIEALETIRLNGLKTNDKKTF